MSMKLIETLIAQRKRCGISQEQVAERMRCTQSRLSKLEHNFDWRLRDLLAYADALGCKIDIKILPRS